jgi:outer membrane usher protein
LILLPKLLLIIICTLSLPLGYAEEGSDDLFRRVFHQDEAQPEEAEFDLLIDQKKTGRRVKILLVGGDRLVGITPSAIEVLKTYLSPTTISKLTSSDSSQGVKSNQLREVDIKWQLHLDRLAVNFTLPAHLKRARSHSLSPNKMPPIQGKLVTPDSFSGYLNWKAFSEYRGVKDGSPAPAWLSLNSAININSYVLEGDYLYQEEEEHHWQRGEWRLIKDNTKYEVRMIAGDLINTLYPYQTASTMSGISVQKEFSLAPYQSVRLLGNHQFQLWAPATVHVYLNNHFYRELRLDSGLHTLSDIPLQSGTNDIRLEVIGQDGSRESIQLSSPGSEQLLRPGVHQFYYAIGTPYSDNNGNRDYQSIKDDGVLSMGHLYGLTHNFTFGPFLQANPKHTVGGAQVIWGTTQGVFTLTQALSNNRYSESGRASKIEYKYNDFLGVRSTTRTIALLYENLSKYFTYLGADRTINELRNKFSATITGTVIDNISSSLSINYQQNSNPLQSDPFGVNLALFGRYGDFSTTFNLGRQRAIDGKWEGLLSIFATLSLPTSNSYITGQADRTSRTKRTGWRRNSPHPVNGVNTNLELTDTVNQQSVSGDLTYLHEKMVATINGEANNLEHESNQERVGLTLASAILFAGGNFAVSRPIANSFVLIRGKESLRSETVLVNPQQGYSEADTSTFGPAVIPNLTPYTYQNIHLSPIKLEPGVSLSQELYTVLPTYHSGTSIVIGNKRSVMLHGTLIDNSGQPLPLMVGRLAPLNSQKIPITIFTNRDGYFEAEGVTAGIYTIELEEKRYRGHQIAITDKQRGIIDIGKVTLEERE